ncbi:heavy metal-binding domain-containing protein, partial [Shewanella atlantica]|uniref:heavy metal-binding domain-containing protein n=1 Tax=Shewanella atlantica TaxID=271099 RepID=UPI0037366236
MSHLESNSKHNKLAYLLSLFMVITPQLAHSQQLTPNVNSQQAHTEHNHRDVSAATYSCPMHPEETSHEAGSRCSICNMFLVEEESDEE